MTAVPAPHARARAATLVVVGPSERLAEAAGILMAADQDGSFRCVLIPTGTDTTLDVETSDDLALVRGIAPAHLNNAIAALRLSSLPTVVWWRGGPPDRLEGTASLADRVVLDAEDAEPLWARAAPLFSRTALTDLRWARLTRWRAVLAHLFDLPRVRDTAASITGLSMAGGDAAQCALFGGWLDTSLGWDGRVPMTRQLQPSGPGLVSVRLDSPDGDVELRLLPGGACLASEARAEGAVLASRVVPAGDESVATLLSEELRIRSRDLAFERALSRIPDLAFRDA